MKNIAKLPLIVSVWAIAGAAMAQNKTFTVVGDKLAYRNLVSVESETEFETFVGKTNGVSGTLYYNATAKRGGGTITVDVKGIDTGIPLRNEHMLSEGWLNAEKYPTIKFVADTVKALGNDKYQVAGKLTLKGVTRPVTTTVTVRYRAAGEATRAAGFDGDVVQIRSSFPIKLSDFGVNVPDNLKTKVANTVTLSISAYAVAK